MFQTIVLATDLSPASNALVDCATGLKKLGVKRVVLTYAMGIRHLDDLRFFIAPLVEPFLLAQKKKLTDQGFDAVIEMAPGIPAEEVERVAKERNASLILIGSHGESIAEHVLYKFGGTASEVLHHFARPLLVVRTQIMTGGLETGVEASCANFRRKMLYCTDFSDTAERAYGYVEEMVEDGCREVTIIHVQDKTKSDGHLAQRLEACNKGDAERMEILRERLQKRGASNVQMKIQSGAPTSEILSEVTAGNYSLIVMGSQGRGFIREMFVGSVSHSVARHAGASVLLIPACPASRRPAPRGSSTPWHPAPSA